MSLKDLCRALTWVTAGDSEQGWAPRATPTTALHRPDDRVLHRRLRWERRLSRAAIVVTLAAFCAFLAAYSASAEAHLRAPVDFLEAATFVLIVALLVYGGLVYLCARVGYMRRRIAFPHASIDELDEFAQSAGATVCVLVPSYKEEPSVVRQTLLSAALQEYPHRRVVLLIDDPPRPSTDHDRDRLLESRRLPRELQELLDRAREPFQAALRLAEKRARRGDFEPRAQVARLASLHARAAGWFALQAGTEMVGDHSDALFVEMCLRGPAGRHEAKAAELRRLLREGGPYPAADELLRRYRRLDVVFAARLTSFERKWYASLSHAANKAMNLNSYIDLMGRSLDVRAGEDGLELHEAAPGDAAFEVPDADYVLTLDADSLLEPSYATRLVHLLEHPANDRVAVAQTPYCAVPGARRSIERIAGATTDLQYVIHQGFTAHGATYWVGANAVLRKRALEDIASTALDARTGRRHTRYIQDRTVIEDTESSVDLVARGWQLFNYPARLSYSATPPDFGALVVQRRRWANGGLLILPKLLRLLCRRRARDAGPLHGFMRVHYLISIAAVNVGLMLLFLVPFSGWYANAWLPLTAVPYFALYTHDLRLAGYRRRDVIRVYALNLLLVPVNLGGVLKSLHQALTGRTTSFKRTPKISGRTSAPSSYLVLPYLLAFFLITGSAWSFEGGNALQGAASALNGGLLIYAIGAFVGWRYSWTDVVAGVRLPPLALPGLRSPLTRWRKN
jgi:cellulose synthase/poly-beta-1,6-N-acetylglucosamine synthase-like glycosyltransferase